jgi:sugar O-acyltransferase (sialic acid O-acetyltransferase NeuD family)
MNKVVLFGNGQFADVAWYYLLNDYLGGKSPWDVVAFTVDSEYIEETTFHDLPVVPFETVEKDYAPDSHSMLVFASYQPHGWGMPNGFRASKVARASQKGYYFATYVSPQAHVLADHIGTNCFILEDNVIQPFVTIGNNTILWSGNHIGHHTTIKANNFISSHVVISGGVTVGYNCFFGVNSTVRDNITIADRCVIGMGAAVTHDTELGDVILAAKSGKYHKKSHELERI